MATNMKNSSLHTRSNSMPSATHPFTLQYDEHFHRLKASAATSSSSSISQKLNVLQDLHDCINKMLQLPTMQQALARESCKTWLHVDELLEESPRLLDICTTAKDVLLQSTESIHELQSVVCRRCDEMALKIEGSKYLSSRKDMKKAIRKASENFKGIKKELNLTSSNKDYESLSMISNLKEAEFISLSPSLN